MTRLYFALAFTLLLTGSAFASPPPVDWSAFAWEVDKALGCYELTRGGLEALLQSDPSVSWKRKEAIYRALRSSEAKQGFMKIVGEHFQRRMTEADARAVLKMFQSASFSRFMSVYGDQAGWELIGKEWSQKVVEPMLRRE